MPTPLTGIPTPTYSPNAWQTIATMAEALEALGVVPFAGEAARDATIPSPTPGQTCFVNGEGICVWMGNALGWQYLAFRTPPSVPEEPPA